MPKRHEIIAEFVRERNVFENPKSRTIIGDAVEVSTGRGLTIKGDAEEDELRYGLVYRFFGYETSHPKYGPQFFFTDFVVETPSTETSVVAYLCQCDGIGPVTAGRLWDAYGVDAVQTLREDPVRCSSEIKGLKESTAKDASKFLETFKAVERTKLELMELFSGRGFPRKLSDNVIKKLGVSSAEQIRRNPYLLMQFRGCGFLKTDKMYLDLRLPPDKLKRQALCAWHSIATDSDGHTWHPLTSAHGAISRRISGGKVQVERATSLAVRGRLLSVCERGGCKWVAEEAKARAEGRCANEIAASLDEAPEWPDLSGASEPGSEKKLSAHQFEQLTKSFCGCIGLLAGSPGTGKTYTAAVVIREIIRKHGRHMVAMAAPTGKAAVRLTEAMQMNGIDASAVTIHRLLQVQSGENGWSFRYNAGNPLPYRFVFIDEPSMIDTDLMAALLSARAPGTQFLFLGDPNQLAPVGHGAPFRDMIAAGVPCGELTEIRRNSGRIVRACAEIRDLRRFCPSPISKLADVTSEENLLHVETSGPSASIDMLQRFFAAIKAGKKYDPVWSVQVLCAVNKKSPLGRRPLNDFLQGMLNPGGERVSGNRFRCGDKIINLKNGWFPSVDKSHPEANENGDVFVANGEIGEAVTVFPSYTICKLPSPDRLIKIPQGKHSGGSDSDSEDDDKKGPSRTDKDEDEDTGAGCTWDLAYAISTHKSQGSEFPVVLVIVDEYPGAQRVCTRNWIYTALSRAKEMCITIGRRNLIDKMCQKDGLRRRTFLVERVKEIRRNEAEVSAVPGKFDVNLEDSGAIAVLEFHGVRVEKGLIHLVKGSLNPDVLDAADYLCDEWDYTIEWVRPVSDDEFAELFEIAGAAE